VIVKMLIPALVSGVFRAASRTLAKGRYHRVRFSMNAAFPTGCRFP